MTLLSETKINPSKQAMSMDDTSLALLLPLFYKRLFPFKEYIRWLKYGQPTNEYLARREFSFTLANDIYIRFQSFENEEELSKELVNMCPVKIDIGAVYSTRPKLKKTVRPGGFVPLEKELVFDIDMTDYDEIRTCCQGGEVCYMCWPFMTIAIRVIDRALRDDFGFRHRLWIYSGRRGVHCWVCDERARKMTNETRASLVRYIEVVKGGENQRLKVYIPGRGPMHPSLDAAYQILKEYFKQLVIQNQHVLDQVTDYKKLVNIISDEKVRNDLLQLWESDLSPSDEHCDIKIGAQQEARWKLLVQRIRAGCSFGDNLVRDIIFQYCYPRLDDKVSTNINHLLKSPFCVHPKTGRVCVPIDPELCDEFDPLQVPTLSSLVEELNLQPNLTDVVDQMDVDEEKRPDWDRTSLRPYILTFRKFVHELEQEQRLKRRDEQDRKMEF